MSHEFRLFIEATVETHEVMVSITTRFEFTECSKAAELNLAGPLEALGEL